MVISDGFHNVVSLNAAQKKLVASGSQSEQRDFLTFVCKAKAVCKNYPDVKQGCAAAGSIQKCIDIRMNGDDSTMCLDNGEIGGLDEQTTPSAIQCTAFKISEFLR